MSSIEPTWEELKTMGKEFIEALPSATQDEIDDGLKCLVLGYIGMKGSEIEINQAFHLLNILHRKVFEKEMLFPQVSGHASLS